MTPRLRLPIGVLCLAAALPAQSRRIVSTAPSITETLFALGLGDRVVGVSSFCHYPAQALRLPKVGTYLQPSLESIVGLRPDLAILLRSPDAAASRVRVAGVHTLELEHGDLRQSFESMERIAAAAGVPDRGRKLVSGLRARLDAISAGVAGRPRRSMVFLVGRNPGRLDGLVAVGKGSYLNELIEIAGGTNALARAAMAYPKVSLEGLLGLDPEVLVDMGDMAETTGVTEERKSQALTLWQRYPKVKAVAANRVYIVASDIFVVPGPRLVDAADAFRRMLHPEAGP